MAYASQSGRAVCDANNPQAYAVCDRCGRWWNRNCLTWQFQYAGASLINLRLLVCEICLDTPAQFLRSVILPPDPLPVRDPRPEFFAADEGPPPPNIPVSQLVPD